VGDLLLRQRLAREPRIVQGRCPLIGRGLEYGAVTFVDPVPFILCGHQKDIRPRSSH
jgi:hypothetical protein